MPINIPFISQPLDQGAEIIASRPWYLFWQALANAVSSGSGSGTGVGTVGGVAIAVICDSHGEDNANNPDHWPSHLQNKLNAKGVPARVMSCGADGMTFYRALNPPVNATPPPSSYFSYGANNAVTQAIAYQANIVLVALGGADSWLQPNIDGRTPGQVQSDAVAVFAALRAGLPNATIAYVSEVWYDANNYPNPGASLANQGCLPFFWQLNTSGILAGLYSSEILGNGAAANSLIGAGDWIALDASIKALTSAQGVDTWFPINFWRMARMGGLSFDGLHPNGAGMVIEASYAMKGFRTAVNSLGSLAFASLMPYIQTSNMLTWEDPDQLFTGTTDPPETSMFTPSGSGWAETYSSNSESVRYVHNLGLRPAQWYLPYKGNVVLNQPPGVGTWGSDYKWAANATAPLQLVSASIDNAAFVSTGTTTDNLGVAEASVTGYQLGAIYGFGHHTLRYKIGNISYGPFSVTINTVTPTALPYNTNWGNFSTFANGTYWKDAFGIVHLSGVASGSGGATSLIATLPAGFRPADNKAIAQLSNGTLGSIEVASNGQITLLTGSIASSGFEGTWPAFN